MSLTKTIKDNVESQYNEDICSEWDELIDWKEREKAEGDFFQKILTENNCKSVIDIATGTGYHAITLAQKNFNVTGIDSSSEMIKKSKSNAIKYNVNINFNKVDWKDLDTQINTKFDAVICLGSSFPHLRTKKDREGVLSKINSILNDDGILIIDHRNFDSLISGNFSNKGNQYYCGKKFDINACLVNPNLVKFSYKSKNSYFELMVYPLTIDELKQELLISGFVDSAVYGDFKPLTNIYNSDFIIHVVSKNHNFKVMKKV